MSLTLTGPHFLNLSGVKSYDILLRLETGRKEGRVFRFPNHNGHLFVLIPNTIGMLICIGLYWHNLNTLN